MNLKLAFELLGSILNFLGGALLTWDALMVRRRILSERGIQAFQDLMEKAGAAESLTYKGRPLKEEANLQLLMSERTLSRARVGLGLVTAGFLLDILGKLTG